MAQGTQAIDRAAAVLSLVIRSEDPVSFTEVADSVGLARSTVSRLLSALERNGLIERGSDGRYRGGELFALYASRFDRVESLILSAEPTLQRIGEQTGETVNLGVPSGDRVVQIAQVSSSFVLGATNWIDADVPAHCSALGKVMYAYGAIPLPTGELERCTDHTVTSLSLLMDELEEIRGQGFAVVHEEFEDGLDAVAAPVRGAQHSIVAAIGISGPTLRIAEEHERLGGLLISEAQKLSDVLTA